MISNFIEDTELFLSCCESPEQKPSHRHKPVKSAHEGSSLDTRQARDSSVLTTQSIARKSLHQPCPGCGSRMVRSRDLRDMCVVCGYLQAQA